MKVATLIIVAIFLSQLAMGAEFSGKCDSLLAAVTKNDVKIVRKLLLKKLDPNCSNEYGQTALMIAASNRNTEITKLLINSGASLNIQDGEGNTSLIYASMLYKEWPHAVKSESDENEAGMELLRHGADVNISNNKGQTPLMIAADNSNYSNKLELIKLMIKNGAKVNAVDENGWNALIYASNVFHLASDNKEVVKELINNGILVNQKSTGTVHFGGRQAGAYTVTKNSTALFLAAWFGKADLVKLLINANADTNVEDEYGNTAIALAYNFEILELLLSANAKIGLEDKLLSIFDGIYTVWFDHTLAATEALIKAGANVNYTDQDGIAASMYAAILGKSEELELLLNAGANPNVQTTKEHFFGIGIRGYYAKGTTPLMLVQAAPFHLKSLQVLISHGANLNLQDENGNTALMNSIFKEEYIEALIAAKADLNLRNRDGMTALGLAKKFNLQKVITLLRNAGGIE